MNQKMLFIYNPHAGKARLKSELSDILDLYVRNGWDVNVHPTQFSGDAIEFVAKRAHEFDLVVCSGGDGTIDEVVEGMTRSEKRIPIGYIPTGTVNDFASSLGLPKDIHEAAAAIMDAAPFPCDIGTFNGRHFNYVAAFGLFTEVSYSTPQDVKNVLGKTAYLLEGAKEVLKMHTYHMKVVTEDRVVEGDYVYGSISNSHSVAGLPVPFHRVDLADGLMEMIFIKKPDPFRFWSMLESMISGTPDPESFDVLRGSRFEITCDAPVRWTLDGEYGGTEQQIIIAVDPKAVDLMVPKPKLELEAAKQTPQLPETTDPTTNE